MSDWYILDENKQPVWLGPELLPAVDRWSKFRKDFENNCRVGDSHLRGGVHVSTVFLGLDHNYGDNYGDRSAPGYQPILFETMIFGGVHNDYQTRYATWMEAEVGHDKAVQLALESFRWDRHIVAEAKRIYRRIRLEVWMKKFHWKRKLHEFKRTASLKWTWFKLWATYHWRDLWRNK